MSEPQGSKGRRTYTSPMSSTKTLQEKLSGLVKSRARAEAQRADAQRDEAKHRVAAAKERSQAERATSLSSRKSCLDRAQREERAADAQARKAADAAKRVATCASNEASCQSEMARARESEVRATVREHSQAMERLKRASETARRDDREWTRSVVEDGIAASRQPAPDKLNILYLTVASRGDLRVDEEIRRVKSAVRATTHRDIVHIEHMPAATTSDLLDGLARVTPHIVHFSGHASEAALVFDIGSVAHNEGSRLDRDLFARALASVDRRPTVIVLNACNTESHTSKLLEVADAVVSMSDSIGDPDAITFATRFYSSIADGQSVQSAFDAAVTQMLMNGLQDALVPNLACAAGIDPSQMRLVPPRHRRRSRAQGA